MGLTGVRAGQAQATNPIAGVQSTPLTGGVGGTRPTTPPTVAVSAVAGNIEPGTRVYAVSFTATGGPPTVPGPPVTSAAFSAGNAQGSLSAIPTGPAGTTERRIWRSKANPPAYPAVVPLYLVGILSDNTTTTFTDNVSDTDLGDPAPSLLIGGDYLQFAQILDAVAGFYAGPTGTYIKNLQLYTPTLTPAAVAANTTAEQTFTVTGLTTADKILFINKPTAQAGLGIVGMRVSAANTLAITFCNTTAGALTPTAGETYQVGAIRS